MPFKNVKVVELTVWVAGPAAAGLMADWGADVVKLEPAGGDPMRRVFGASSGMHDTSAPPFNLDNRGKRSVVVDLQTERGIDIAMRLLEQADVFVTNLRPDALERLALDYPTVSKHNPRLIYATVTGYGHEGPDRARAAYDVGAFWARTGIAQMLSRTEGDPSPCRPAFGDHVTALSLLAGIGAALFERERNGQGKLVETSLLRTGAYTAGWDLATYLELGWYTKMMSRDRYVVPLVNCYKAGDGQWFWLLGLEADRHWPKLLRIVEHEELEHDPRFETSSGRAKNAAELIKILDAEFAKRGREEWGERFNAEDLWWSPVQTLEEITADPQAAANGVFVDYTLPGGAGSARSVAGPVDFGGAKNGPSGPPPTLGEHTDEVLKTAGYDESEIDDLRRNGIIG